MDKYEYRLKAEQIEKLVKKRDYEEAAKIADTIDWRRVKNLDTLYTISEIYEATERYEDCMEILSIAYDRAPVGRLLLYKMTEIATKMHNFDEAIGLYREFVKSAPHDQSRYILKYQIYRERGSSLDDQILILQDYKSHEYQEKWAYELASLYAEAGYTEDCVRECDELILWFSEGEYVMKAMDLKMQFAPLSPEQQKKYNYTHGISGIEGKNFEEMEAAISIDKFSTMNLQAELAENIGELIQEDKTIQMPTLDIEAALGDLEKADAGTPVSEETGALPELEFEEFVLPEESAQPEAETEAVETAAIKTAEPEVKIEVVRTAEPEPEESAMAEQAQPETTEEAEPDILQELGLEELGVLEGTGVLPKLDLEEFSIPEESDEEVSGSESEGAKEAEPEPETGEEAKPDILQELGLEELGVPEGTGVLPKLELEDLVLPGEAAGEPEPEEPAGEPELKPEEPDMQKEPERIPQEQEEEAPVEKQITGQLTIDDILAEWENKKAETEAILEANAGSMQEHKEKVKQETAELMKLISGNSEAIPEDVQQILEEIDEEKQPQEEPVMTEDDLPQDLDIPDEEETAEITVEDLEPLKESKTPETKKEQVPQSTTSMNMIQELERSLAAEVSEMAVNSGHLTKEQARLFAYFTSVKGMSQQLSVLFKDEVKNKKNNSSSGNLVVTGRQGNGKTTLAIDIVKALQRQKRIEGKKLAKISGQRLNSKDIYDVLSKLKGGALIIESAGGLSEASVMALSLAMEADTGGLLVILEDSAEEIQRIFLRNKNFASKFDHTIDIPTFSNDELVAFGKSYAREEEYVFDEFAVLALYDRIGARQTNDHMVTVAEVKDIVDAAIAHSERGGVRHMFARMTKKNVDEFGNHLLREDDFDEA